MHEMGGGIYIAQNRDGFAFKSEFSKYLSQTGSRNSLQIFQSNWTQNICFIFSLIESLKPTEFVASTCLKNDFVRQVLQTHRQVFCFYFNGEWRKSFSPYFLPQSKRKSQPAPSNTFHSLAPLLLAGFCFHFLFLQDRTVPTTSHPARWKNIFPTASKRFFPRFFFTRK